MGHGYGYGGYGHGYGYGKREADAAPGYYHHGYGYGGYGHGYGYGKRSRPRLLSSWLWSWIWLWIPWLSSIYLLVSQNFVAFIGICWNLLSRNTDLYLKRIEIHSLK